MIKRSLTALRFLTILPIRGDMPTKAEMAACIAAFPLVGLLQGALLVLTAYSAGKLFPPGVSASLILTAYVVLTGGFHLDGLADTFDAIAKRGSKQEKLSVMKDGRTGPLGVAAITLSLLLKFALLSRLSDSRLYFIYLLYMPVFSKWPMVVSMAHGRPARQDGLGKIFIEGTGVREFFAATSVMLIIAGVPIAMEAAGALAFLAAGIVVVLYLFGLFWVRLSERQFGGLTGDTLGAIAELSEIIYLLMALAWP